MNRLVLVKPSLEYKELIIDMLDEWMEYNRTHVCDPSPRAILTDYQDFDAYINKFKKAETDPEPGLVPAVVYFALDKERNIIVGALQIRLELNEALRNSGGHIGDGIRPSERRKGYATEMIGLALDKCKEYGIDKVLISCNEDNIGSKKSIIKNGGVYERTVLDDGKNLELYWIDLDNEIRIVYDEGDCASFAMHHYMFVGECEYEIKDDRWFIVHTGVRPEYGGRGIAKQLVLKIIEEARKKHVKIVPICSYAQKLMLNNKEYEDVLAESYSLDN